MYLEARVKSSTPIMSKPNSLGKAQGKIKPNTRVVLVSLHKDGMESYYKTSTGGYLNAADVIIDRDVEFSSERVANSANQDPKNPFRRSFGGVMGSMQRFLTHSAPSPTSNNNNYTFRPAGTSSLKNSVNYSTISDQSVMTGGKGVSLKNTSFADINGSSNKGPSRSDRINAMSIDKVLRVKNKTVSSLLKGATIGNIRDGSFFSDILKSNFRGLLGGLLSSRLSYVIGFDFGSNLENIFNIFGETFPNLNSKVNSILGGNSNGSLFSGDSRDWPGVRPSFDNGGSLFDGQYEHRQLIYAEIDQAAIEYFRYKGCDGQKIIKRFGGIYEWEQDASYATVLVTDPPNIPEEDVQIFKDMNDDLYDEYTDGMEAIYNEFNIHTDRATIFNKFNRYRLPTPNNELIGSKGHIFFTRPDMNLSFANDKGESVLNLDVGVSHAHATALMYSMLKSHPVLSSYLMGASAGAGHSFIPILTDRCTGLDVQDEVLETTEHGETLTGWKNTYGQSTIKTKTAGTVNVNFRDDDMLSVYKIMKIWIEYINAVYRGEAMPNPAHANRRELDYAISIYYFLTKTTGEDILYWCKYTGCFPTNIPSSNFADSVNETIKQPTYTITFNYSKKDDYNPLHVAEFNYLSQQQAFHYIPVYNQETHHSTKTFVGCPFVDTGNGGELYKLRYRPE